MFHIDDEVALAPARPWWILTTLCLAVFLVVVDNTIVNVALPTLALRLHASDSVLQWIVDGYSLPFAGLLLAGGEAADRFGRRRVMHLALAAFAAASFLAAISHSSRELLVARALMGAAAAFIFPATLSLVNSTFPDPRRRTAAFGIWGATVGIAIAVGPIAGGYLLNHYWYGSVFLVSVPVALVAIAATALVVVESRSPQVGHFDGRGLVLGVAGITLLTYGIIEGPSWGWAHPTTVAVLLLSVVTLAGFCALERRTVAPLLDVRVFANRAFSSAAAAVAVSFFCLFGFIFVVTQYFQLVRGYSPLSAGVHTLPFAAVTALVTPVGTWLTVRIGARWVVSGGLTLMGVALWWMATLSSNVAYLGPVVGSMMLLALGFSLISAPSTSTLMNALSASQVGAGAAVNETTRELGGTLGVAVVGSVFSSVFGPHIVRAFAHWPIPPYAVAIAERSMQGALVVLTRLPHPLRGALRPEVVNAFMAGFHRACELAGTVTIVVGVLVFWFLPGPLASATRDPE